MRADNSTTIASRSSTVVVALKSSPGSVPSGKTLTVMSRRGVDIPMEYTASGDWGTGRTLVVDTCGDAAVANYSDSSVWSVNTRGNTPPGEPKCGTALAASALPVIGMMNRVASGNQ